MYRSSASHRGVHWTLNALLPLALLGGISCSGDPSGRRSAGGTPTLPALNSTSSTPVPVSPSPVLIPSPGVGPNGMPLPAATPGPTALRRLTNDEYRNTVQELLSLAVVPREALVPETRSHGYNNFGTALTVPPTLLEQYQTIATNVAKTADIAALAPCVAPTRESECARAFVQTFGAKAFRRPLTSSEADEYMTLYTLAQAEATYADGLRHVLETMLYSPQLLYRFELGAATVGDRRTLSSYEVATELSYLLTAGPPDPELSAAATANMLTSPSQVAPHARRLLSHPRARAQFRSLLTQWFETSRIGEINKDPTLYPSFTETLRASMAAESNAFIDAILWENDGKFSTLLTAPFSWVNAELAVLYGVPDPGTGTTVSRVNLNASERSGFLTQASVLAVHAQPGDSGPIKRGKFVREVLLCQPLAPPPPSLNVAAPVVDPNLTTRERFAAHSASPACAGCHSLIDGIGFGLEAYDAIGHFRTRENGRAVDAAGMLTSTDVDGPYSGGVELAAKLSSSSLAAGCAGLQAYRWAFGRLEGPGELEMVQAVVAQLGQSQTDLRELVLSLTQTDSFFVRTQIP